MRKDLHLEDEFETKQVSTGNLCRVGLASDVPCYRTLGKVIRLFSQRPQYRLPGNRSQCSWNSRSQPFMG